MHDQEQSSRTKLIISAAAALIQIGVYMRRKFLFSSAWYVKWTDWNLNISEGILFSYTKNEPISASHGTFL